MDHDDGSPTWIVRLDPAGPGVRLAVKDCIDVAGLPTTVGCPVIAERALPAARDAAVVAAARRSGAQIVGKTNLSELCWSAAGTNAWSRTPVNPADPSRLPGGSSSGSAVAVAAGGADVAAVELGMRLIEPGFAAGSCELRVAGYGRKPTRPPRPRSTPRLPPPASRSPRSRAWTSPPLTPRPACSSTSRPTG